MGDDDSIFFVENWVDVLAKYDHTRYIYIGGQSETVMSNFYYSFDQGFGGAGFALSYPLASAMVKDLEGCPKRYPDLNLADFITKFCVDELGVSLSAERGIHQEMRDLSLLHLIPGVVRVTIREDVLEEGLRRNKLSKSGLKVFVVNIPYVCKIVQIYPCCY